MKNPFFLICILLPFYVQGQALQLDGLQEEVEVFRDPFGINHIYAQNEHDLFFSQGYMAAKDRLFQFEIWRRQATGTVAEILGEKELKRDIATRLFKFRGGKKEELSHYHPRGEQIISSYVEGVNAYIEETRKDPSLLPAEFELLGIVPQPWTWEVVISRHQGLLGNVNKELEIGRMVSMLGEEKVKELYYFHPFDPEITIDPSIPQELLFKDLLELYNAFRSPLQFAPSDITASARNKELADIPISKDPYQNALDLVHEDPGLGSNNWVISGEHTASGYPMMANDPHRAHSAPSLRYWVHLNAPGWNVIGAGEPEIPGVSVGHNEYGTWGLTIFSTDSEDIKVYEIHPDNPKQYQYRGKWLEMEVIKDKIAVKEQDSIAVEYLYTVHGPVVFTDEALHKAVAIQCAWLEPGSAPYLASLRMAQAKNWEEFREACAYNFIPAENMVWADPKGNIGWQATGIAPIRKNFSGMVPLPGNGKYEWEGYLPMLSRPHAYNPENGIIATSNQNLTGIDYSFPEAIGYTWADPFRGNRIREVLQSGTKFTLQDMAALQNDDLALPARMLVPLLKELQSEDEKVRRAMDRLLDWDFRLGKSSLAAGIYVMWERELGQKILNLMVPEEARATIGSVPLTRMIEWLTVPPPVFGKNPTAGRDHFLMDALENAVAKLEIKLGPDMEDWYYGQPAYKHALIKHPLSDAVNEEWQEKLNAGPLPRGGYSYTPSANSYGDNNTTGGSFKLIVDTEHWEKALGINTPGQSGDPESPFYKNLFELWANDKYFPVYYSRKKIEESSVETVKMIPKQ